MAVNETLSVFFLRTTWCANDHDEDGLTWGIFKANEEHEGDITIKGKLEPCMCNNGMTFEISGHWENDSKYGRQFVFNNYSRKQPAGRWGTMAFLMQAEGIGETLAGRIWEAFGEESIDTMIEQPAMIASRVPGVRPDVADSAAEALAPMINQSKLKLPLLTLFKGTKLPAKTAQRVLDSCMADPVNTITKNPFILMCFGGIAFKQADSLRLKLKLPPTMPERVQAACEQAFHDESDQTWLFTNLISNRMSDLLELQGVNAQLEIQKLVETSKIVKSAEGDWYALTKQAENERFVASCVHQRMQQPPPMWLYNAVNAIEPGDPETGSREITKHQKEVLRKNIGHGGRICVLPGSPGTGKTHTLGRLLSLFKGEVLACAPTGKAAQRLTQSLRGITATTIHRLLEPKPLSGGGFMFSLQNGEIKAEVVAVDEASMVNNELAAALFRGLSPETYLVLVGDQNQLPPVGPGTMLRDLQSTGIFEELTEIRRNAGMIVKSCASIREMKQPQFHLTANPGTAVRPETNVHLMMASKDIDKAKRIQVLVDMLLCDGIIDSAGRKVDILHGVQFLTATHKNPVVGREAMNTYLQKRFNPKMDGLHSKFKVGDKVICTENCFLEPIIKKPNQPTKIFIANGELGVIMVSLEKRVVVKMTSTNEEVMVPCGAEGNGWDLGYCITCHKAQGSEWPVTVTMMGSDFGSNMVMSREWVYTALSRAKELSIVFAGPGQIQQLVKKARIGERKSFMLKYWKEWGKEEDDI